VAKRKKPVLSQARWNAKFRSIVFGPFEGRRREESGGGATRWVEREGGALFGNTRFRLPRERPEPEAGNWPGVRVPRNNSEGGLFSSNAFSLRRRRVTLGVGGVHPGDESGEEERFEGKRTGVTQFTKSGRWEKSIRKVAYGWSSQRKKALYPICSDPTTGRSH